MVNLNKLKKKKILLKFVTSNESVNGLQLTHAKCPIYPGAIADSLPNISGVTVKIKVIYS